MPWPCTALGPGPNLPSSGLRPWLHDPPADGPLPILPSSAPRHAALWPQRGPLSMRRGRMRSFGGRQARGPRLQDPLWPHALPGGPLAAAAHQRAKGVPRPPVVHAAHDGAQVRIVGLLNLQASEARRGRQASALPQSIWAGLGAATCQGLQLPCRTSPTPNSFRPPCP